MARPLITIQNSVLTRWSQRARNGLRPATQYFFECQNAQRSIAGLGRQDRREQLERGCAKRRALATVQSVSDHNGGGVAVGCQTRGQPLLFSRVAFHPDLLCPEKPVDQCL
jgi:hypothetical protein